MKTNNKIEDFMIDFVEGIYGKELTIEQYTEHINHEFSLKVTEKEVKEYFINISEGIYREDMKMIYNNLNL